MLNKIHIKSAHIVACLLVLGVLCVVGCGGRTGDATPPSEFVAPPDLQLGGTLRLGLLSVPEHLDPHNSVGSGVLNWTAGLVYSRLFRFVADADRLDANRMRPLPKLATD